jgi:hypothetical protein
MGEERKGSGFYEFPCVWIASCVTPRIRSMGPWIMLILGASEESAA